MRRILALILALSMCMSLLSTSVWAADLSVTEEPAQVQEDESAEEVSEQEDASEEEEAEDEEEEVAAAESAEASDVSEAEEAEEPDEQEAEDDEDASEPSDGEDSSEEKAQKTEGVKEEPALEIAANDPTAPTGKSLTYNGTEQQLVDAGNQPGGDVYYYVTESDSYVPVKSEGGWVTNPNQVKAKDVGTYYIHYYFKVGSDESAIGMVQTTIAKGLAIPYDKVDDTSVHTSSQQVAFRVAYKEGNGTVTYNGADQAPELVISIYNYDDYLDPTNTLTATSADYTVSYYKGSEPVSAPKDVGEYTVVVNPAGNYALYSASYPITIPFKIVKQQYNLTVAMDSWTYGSTAKDPTVGNVLSGGTVTVTYKKATDPDTAWSSTKPTQVGSYQVRATTPATANYEAAEGSAEFNVTRRTLTVTAKDHSIEYGSDPANNGVQYSNFAPGEDASALTGAPTFEYTYEKGDSVGEYYITPKQGTLSSGNYRFNFVNGKLTVTKRKITVTPGAQTVKYGDPIDQSKVSGSPMPEGLGDHVTADLTPSTTDVTGNKPGTITPSNIKVLDKDGKDVTDNYDITPATGVLNVEPKTLPNGPSITVTLPDAGYTYDGTSHKPGAPNDPGVVEVKDPDTGDVIDPSEYDLIYTKKDGTTPDDCINAGDYTVTVKFLPNSNYTNPDGKDASTDYTVKKRPVTVKGPTVLVPYKGSVPTVSADQCAVATDSLPLVAGDKLSDLKPVIGSADVDTTKPVGTKTALPISQGENADPNYDVTMAPGTYEISKAPAAIVLSDNYRYTYDGTKRSPAIAVQDQRSNPVLDLLTTVFGDQKEAEVYYSTETSLNDSNYNTAGKKDVGVVGPDVTEGTTVYYYVKFPAGNYERDEALANNGAISGSTTVIIDPAPLKITAKDQNIPSNGSLAQGVSQVTVEGLVNNDELTSVTLSATPTPGQYTDIVPSGAIINGGTGTKNYAPTYVNGKLGTRGTQDAPNVNVKEQTPNTITIKPDPGVEYIISKDPNLNPTDNDFKPSNPDYFKPEGDNPANHPFEGLDPNTPYYIYARKPAQEPTQNDPGKDASPVTKKETATTPEPPAPPYYGLTVDYVKETVKPIDNTCELRVPGKTAPSAYVDTETEADPTDKVYVRVKANGNVPASADAETILDDRPDAPAQIPSTDFERTTTSVTVNNAKDGQVYIIKEAVSGSAPTISKSDWLNDGVTPSDGKVEFTGLEPGKQYFVFTRYPGSNETQVFASKNSTGASVKTKQTQAKPADPEASSDHPYKITVPVVKGQEYRLKKPDGNYTDWKLADSDDDIVYTEDDGVYPDPTTPFEVYTRLPDTADKEASPVAGPAKVTPKKFPQTAQAPVVEPTSPTTAKVTLQPGEQYSTDGGRTWKTPENGATEVTLTNLTPNSEVKVWTKKPEDKTHYASDPAGPTTATTPKADQTAEAPVVNNTTPTSITINTKPGEQYSIDGGKTWTPVADTAGTYTFPDLTTGQPYDIISKKPETETHNESPIAGPTTATPQKGTQTAQVPEITGTTPTSVTIKPKPDEVYSIDGGKTWVKPTDPNTHTFTGLTPNTPVEILAKKPETATLKESPVAGPAKTTTPKENQTAKTPVVTKTTPTTITIKANPDEEYSIDGGKTWVKPNTGATEYTFPNRKPNTTYNITARKPATNTKNASPVAGPTKAKTPTDTQTKPKKPEIIGTDYTSVDVKQRPGEEYSIDGGKTWKTGKNGVVTFPNLKQDTPYKVIARKKATATKKASPVSDPASAKTKKMTSTEEINKGLKVTQTDKQINIEWGKVSTADGYKVYVQYCGTDFKKKPDFISKKVQTVKCKVTKINGKALNLTKNYKVYVEAYKKVNGKEKIIAKTMAAHIVGRKNTKFTNVKDIKLDNTSFTLKKGQKAKITGKVLLVDPKRQELGDDHAPTFRFSSGNRKVITVNGKGVMTAAGKGSCTVFVYARNGFAKMVKVTVI